MSRRSVRSEQFFDRHGRARESAVARRLIKGWLGTRIGILRQLSDTQGKLLGLYTDLGTAVSQARRSLVWNQALYNAASNQALHTDAVLLLCERGLYGAARPILRQEIEGLLVAKASTLNPALIDRWKTPEGKRTGKTSIRMQHDVLNSFRPKRGNSKLQTLWRELNETTHYTPFAAQEPRVNYRPESSEDKRHLISQYQRMIGNTHQVVDWVFLTLKMHEHLLTLVRLEGADLLLENELGARFARREQELLNRAKQQNADYCKANRVRLNRELLGVAFEYRVHWHPVQTRQQT